LSLRSTEIDEKDTIKTNILSWYHNNFKTNNEKILTFIVQLLPTFIKIFVGECNEQFLFFTGNTKYIGVTSAIGTAIDFKFNMQLNKKES